MRVYLFPTELESMPFRTLCPDANIVISGVGMAATAATIARLDRERRLSAEDVVLLCGIAGAYGDRVAIGDVVEVMTECCVELPKRFRESYTNTPLTSLRGVSSNSVHHSGADAEGADIENMEGATLFALSKSMGFRAAEIRAVSNRVGDSFDRWSIEEAVNALAMELIKLENGE